MIFFSFLKESVSHFFPTLYPSKGGYPFFVARFYCEVGNTGKSELHLLYVRIPLDQPKPRDVAQFYGKQAQPSPPVKYDSCPAIPVIRTAGLQDCIPALHYKECYAVIVGWPALGKVSQKRGGGRG